MNRTKPQQRSSAGAASRRSGTSVAWVVSAAVLVSLARLNATDMAQHLESIHAGGMPPGPVITSINTSTQGVTLTWRATAGPYQVQQLAPGVTNTWQNVGDSTDAKSVTLSLTDPATSLRVQGASPKFAGAAVCAQCHFDTHADWTTTAHSTALDVLKQAGQGTNSSCLPCHTVGYGLSTGYINEAQTPHLAGVQCENCHGPADAHARNPSDLSVRPIVEQAGTLCGGCHSGAHNPMYDEWSKTAHATVVPDVASSMLATNGTSRFTTCGPCHSGAVRLALLNSIEDNPLIMPSQADAAAIAVTCTVCHNPHSQTVNDKQLRFPTFSTNQYSYSTSKDFGLQYNENINVCGQCHNMRGAAWTDTSRPPHHSPQYNMLIGQGGYAVGDIGQSAHGVVVTNQCAGCHMQPQTVSQPTPENPNYSGHGYYVQFTACLPCHDSTTASNKVDLTQSDTKNRIATVQGLLNQWATSKATGTLTNYGTLAWEYTNPGDLSNPYGTNTGPSSAEQKLIPNAIKQARYNLYLVQYDGSFGVHNAVYMRSLLRIAEENVNAALTTP